MWYKSILLLNTKPLVKNILQAASGILIILLMVIISRDAYTGPVGSGISYTATNITYETKHDDTVIVRSKSAGYQTFNKVLKKDKLPEKSVVEKFLFDNESINRIDLSVVDFMHRYSPTKKIINADSVLAAASSFIPVKEGEFYTVSGVGIYNIKGTPQGGYFAKNTDTQAIGNITFYDSVLEGKVFQVPTGQGINYVVIQLNTNASHNAVEGNTQMEAGESATVYQPYKLKKVIKKELLPNSGGDLRETTVLNNEAWYKYTEGENKSDILKLCAPVFRKHYLLRDKDLVIVNTGTSLTARTNEHCSDHPAAMFRPPLGHSNNMYSIVWDKLKWDNQFYRRYDSGFFTENQGGFVTTSNLPEWDDKIARAGLTRYNKTNSLTGLVLSAKIPASAWQYNFIYRTDTTGSEQVRINIAEGTGLVQVFDESDQTWKEANGFIFSMKEPDPIARVIAVPKPSNDSVVNRTIPSKGNTTYQKRVKMRCKGGTIDSRATEKNITFTKVTPGRFMYWGVEWCLREFMVTYINAARGSHNTQAETAAGLPRFADNEIWSFKPDLMLFELPIHNDGAAGARPFAGGYWWRLTRDFVFRKDYELSMVTRSQALNRFVPELIMFTSSISWNFKGINDDGTLMLGEQNDGTMMTALDKYNQAYQWVSENHPEAGIINSVQRWVEAGNAIFGDLKKATQGSGKTGKTFTNEGSHWNDTGSKIIAKTLTGLFD